MAKYLVIFGLTATNEKNKVIHEDSIERTIDCSSSELQHKISETKESLESTMRSGIEKGGFSDSLSASFRVIQVLPL